MSPGSPGQRLEQRPQRRDADARRRSAAPCAAAAPGGGERAVGPFGQHRASPAAALRSAALCSPAILTVMRSRPGPGAADSEYGLAAHQRSRVRNRQRKNWPGSAPSSSRCCPVMYTETTSAALAAHLEHPHPVPERGADRRDHAGTRAAAPRRRCTAPTTAQRALGVVDEVGAGGELVAERQGDRQIGVEVDEVPRLVATAGAARRGPT